MATSRSDAPARTRQGERAAPAANGSAEKRERKTRIADRDAVARAAKRITRDHRELIEDLAK